MSRLPKRLRRQLARARENDRLSALRWSVRDQFTAADRAISDALERSRIAGERSIAALEVLPAIRADYRAIFNDKPTDPPAKA